MNPHRLVLLGPPASGKGTQGRLLTERWRVPVVSAGEVLRAEIAANTPLGQEAARYMTDGGLVPDQTALAAVEGWLAAHGDEFVFDGFPRTVGQAEALDAILAAQDRALTGVATSPGKKFPIASAAGWSAWTAGGVFRSARTSRTGRASAPCAVAS